MVDPHERDRSCHRVTWKGVITFGLVGVPVQLYAATEEHSGPTLHQVHAEDGARIRQKRFCEAGGVEVPYGEEEAAAGGGDNVIDLMSVLRSSVQAAKSGHARSATAGPAATAGAGAGAGAGEGVAPEPAARKAPAEKAIAKKAAAARKAPAKKTAAKTTAEKAAPRRAS
nr:Ku protein [Streptomyces sp. NRRL B-24484]